MAGTCDVVYAEIELKEMDTERKKKEGLFVKHTLCAW